MSHRHTLRYIPFNALECQVGRRGVTTMIHQQQGRLPARTPPYQIDKTSARQRFNSHVSKTTVGGGRGSPLGCGRTLKDCGYLAFCITMFLCRFLKGGGSKSWHLVARLGRNIYLIALHSDFPFSFISGPLQSL